MEQHSEQAVAVETAADNDKIEVAAGVGMKEPAALGRKTFAQKTLATALANAKSNTRPRPRSDAAAMDPRLHYHKKQRYWCPLVRITDSVILHASMFEHILFACPTDPDQRELTLGFSNTPLTVKVYLNERETLDKVMKRVKEYHKKFTNNSEHALHRHRQHRRHRGGGDPGNVTRMTRSSRGGAATVMAEDTLITEKITDQLSPAPVVHESESGSSGSGSESGSDSD